MEEVINGFPIQETPKTDFKNFIILALSSLVLILGIWGGYGKFQDYKESILQQGIKTGKEQGYLDGQTDLGKAIIQELSKTGRILINTKDAQGNPFQLSLVPQLPNNTTNTPPNTENDKTDRIDKTDKTDKTDTKK